jgi:hypothetical protein
MTQRNHNLPEHISEEAISDWDYFRLLAGKHLNSIILILISCTMLKMREDSEDALIILEGIVHPVIRILGDVYPRFTTGYSNDLADRPLINKSSDSEEKEI